MLCHLDGCHADAPARAENQDALTRPKLTALDQCMPCGRGSGLPASPFAERERRWQGSDGGLRHDPLFRQCAALAASHNAIADFQAVHVCCRLDHFTCRFQTGYERWIGPELIFALRHQQVGEVEAGGANPDPDFAVVQRACFCLQNLDGLRATQGGASGSAIGTSHDLAAATISRVKASISKRFSLLS